MVCRLTVPPDGVSSPKAYEVTEYDRHGHFLRNDRVPAKDIKQYERIFPALKDLGRKLVVHAAGATKANNNLATSAASKDSIPSATNSAGTKDIPNWNKLSTPTKQKLLGLLGNDPANYNSGSVSFSDDPVPTGRYASTDGGPAAQVTNKGGKTTISSNGTKTSAKTGGNADSSNKNGNILSQVHLVSPKSGNLDTFLASNGGVYEKVGQKVSNPSKSIYDLAHSALKDKSYAQKVTNGAANKNAKYHNHYVKVNDAVNDLKNAKADVQDVHSKIRNNLGGLAMVAGSSSKGKKGIAYLKKHVDALANPKTIKNSDAKRLVKKALKGAVYLSLKDQTANAGHDKAGTVYTTNKPLAQQLNNLKTITQDMVYNEQVAHYIDNTMNVYSNKSRSNNSVGKTRLQRFTDEIKSFF